MGLGVVTLLEEVIGGSLGSLSFLLVDGCVSPQLLLSASSSCLLLLPHHHHEL